VRGALTSLCAHIAFGEALWAFLAFCGRVVYGCHPAPAAPFGLTPLQDQQCAGALMWFWVTIAYLVPAIAVTLRLLSPRPEVLQVTA